MKELKEVWLPAGAVSTVYGTGTLYCVKPPEGGAVQVVMIVGLHRVLGADPLSREELEEFARRKDRENWDETANGRYDDAQFMGCNVTHEVSLPETPIAGYDN